MFDCFGYKEEEEEYVFNVYVIIPVHDNKSYNVFIDATTAYESYNNAINNCKSKEYIIGPIPYHKIQNPNCELKKEYQ